MALSRDVLMLRAIGAIAAGALTLASGPAFAEKVSFEGQRLNALIGSSPGGGTDGTTRLVGRFLEKYLPGNPQMVYRNMPAGHGVMATNFFANEAPTDGTYWLGGSSAYVDANNLRKDVVKFDPRTFEYIGGVARGGSVVTMRKSKMPNLTDKTLPPVIVGELDGSRSWSQMIQWGAEYLGWNVKFVIGYPGSAALNMAARRGEIDAFGTSTVAMHRSLEKTGEFVGLAQLGEAEEGKIVPRVSFPDVPVMPHLLEGKLDPTAQRAFNYWVKTNQIDKWYALPPKTPQPIAEAYRAAYQKAVKDPEFLKFAQLQFSEDFKPYSAKVIHDLISSTAYPDTDIIKFLQDLKVKQGLPATPLSDEEMAKLAEIRGGILKVDTKLEDVKNGGREIHFKNEGEMHTADVSGSRTKVMIGGKQAKRSALKPGMTCQVSYTGDKAEAKEIACN